MCWAWRRATTAARSTGGADEVGAPPEGGVGSSAVSLPVDTAARADEEPKLRSPVVAGPCSLRKFRRCSRRAAKNASRVGGGHERRPVRASAAPSSNAFRAASEIFSSALAREIQRAYSPAVNWFWRMYAFCSSGPGLWTPLRRRSIESSSTRA